MTLQELYRQLQGDYNIAISRLMNDSLIDRFVRKFPADPTMQQLRDAMASHDREAIFVASHTLKGVAGNLSFSALHQAALALTEQMRSKEHDADEALYAAIDECYDLAVRTIRTYIQEAS